MAKLRQTLQTPLEVTIAGKVYRGYYEISGTRKLRVAVHYRGRVHADSADYRPDQIGYLREMARQLLYEMLTAPE